MTELIERSTFHAWLTNRRILAGDPKWVIVASGVGTLGDNLIVAHEVTFEVA